MKEQQNNGFKMWANYVEAIDNYTKGNDEQFGRFMRILCYYGIYNVELAETEIEKLFFTGIKSSIDTSIQNIQNGMKGGQTKAERHSNFVKPTPEEIKVYCEERKNKVDPAAFFDYYERNGWVYGKNRMPIKDWKACVRTWERNEKIDIEGLHSRSDESL